jgi:pilus assembly protein TadC
VSAVAAVLLAAALLLLPPPAAVARGRLALSSAASGSERGSGVLAVLVALAAGASVALLAGGVGGAVAGVAVAAVVHRLVARLGREADEPADPLAVAGSLDLLAACLRAGLPLGTAAGVVAGSAPPRLAAGLRRAAELLALGAEPAAAWASLAQDPACEGLARMARRSGRSGSSLAAGVSELAATGRAQAQDAAAATAERAGVLVTGPLGLCFLPAFVALGVVPVVLGLAGPVLRGGLV